MYEKREINVLDKGFTVIEVVIVMAIFLALVSLSYINFIRPQKSANSRSIVSILRNDVRHQQLKTMFSQNNSGNNSKTHGVYFDSYAYTLYTNDNYSGSDPTNFEVSLPSTFEFSSIDLPSSEIIFGSVDGSNTNFNQSQDSVTLRDTTSGEEIVITINYFGVISTSP